jgi:hypothetical protein
MVTSLWAKPSPPKTGYLPDLSMIYQNHPLSANTTRVLRVLPATTPDQSEIISCRLSVVSLDPAPEYRALSYVWGHPSGKRFILIDDTRFRVRNNLWNYLAQARSDGYVDPLWIDAICINQSDLDERSKQVAIMGQIYSKATEVRAWLGAGTTQNLLAMQYIDEINWKAVSGQSKEKEGSSIADSQLEPIQKLLETEYWSRLWIMQEFVLANSVTLQCGPKTIPGATFDQMVHAATSTPSRPFKKQLAGTTAFNILRSRRNYAKRKVQQTKSYFLLALGSSSRLQCADPHDYVYAVLSLDSEASAEIVPDYSKPHLMVLLEVISYFEKRLKALGPINYQLYESVADELQRNMGLGYHKEATQARERLKANRTNNVIKRVVNA